MHPLEKEYGLSADELLTALQKRFRARVTLEGAVAEVQMSKLLLRLKQSKGILDFIELDKDSQPDFEISVKLNGKVKIVRLEVKNVRNTNETKGQQSYYKVEVQKTRTSNADPSSRYYGTDQFEILAVCLGKKTRNWDQFLFIKTTDLKRNALYPAKLSVMHNVPASGHFDLKPWYDDLQELVDSLEGDEDGAR